VIPAEAIEAAAQLIYRTSGRKRVMSYEQARPACADEAREILEAAAPHMLAEAWDEGARAGEDNVWAGERQPTQNPYATSHGSDDET
jgi:hypothetical protein